MHTIVTNRILYILGHNLLNIRPVSFIIVILRYTDEYRCLGLSFTKHLDFNMATAAAANRAISKNKAFGCLPFKSFF